MDEITLTNATRILKFLQAFKMDFNNYSIWNYSRKKFHLSESDRPLIDKNLDFLETNGYIEKVRRPGYYRLTVAGENFESWEIENTQKSIAEEAMPKLNKWRQWLLSGKSEVAQV